jgi:hypothetical protein
MEGIVRPINSAFVYDKLFNLKHKSHRGARQLNYLSFKRSSSIMIHTVGFQSPILSSVTENIDKFIEDMTKQHDSTFRLIDIKFAATAKPLESTRKQSDVDYSALVIYEI